MKYPTNNFIYPPRPALKAQPGELDKYDTGEYLAQPKYNGDCVILVICPGKELQVYNRHKSLYTKNDPIKLTGLNLDPQKSYVIAGEYLSKSKTGENGKLNKAFIIWDILVWENDWLINSTFEERALMMIKYFPASRSHINSDGELEIFNHLLRTKQEGIYLAPVYENDFTSLFSSIQKTDLYEGLVLKKRKGRLAPGLQEENNTSWQIKFRKEAANYKF